MAPPSSPKRNRDLPNDLLRKMILPRLPFKCLTRMKCISKELHSLISTDLTFATDQARAANTSSSSFVFMKDGVLSFLPDPELIGVSDPSLNFLNPRPYNDVDLVCSTNGLLLLKGEFNRKTSFCVCNPATKEMAFVPNPVNLEKNFDSDMGLSYDPCKLPDQFTIVHPELHNHRDGWLYQFNVFRSNTGKWTHSPQSVCVGSNSATNKPVCANGVIYWPCGKYLLWYDTKRDLAGSVMWPVIEGMINIEVYAGEITFCRTWGGGMEVWRLTGGSRWDRLHAASWDIMVDTFNFSHGKKLRRRKSRSEMFFKRHVIFPVGFVGQFVYIAMELKHRDDTSRLFCWEIASGRIEEKGLIGLSSDWDSNEEVFQYVNSMARVPQILNGTSY